MSITHKQIVILGAGLTGLTLSYLLKKEGLETTVLEARNRLGGRIYTHYSEGLAPIEMGATWFGNEHKKLRALLKELGLGQFEQSLGDAAIYEPFSTSPHQLVQLPPSERSTYRIAGGTSQLIKALSEQVAPEQIHLGHVVKSVSRRDDTFLVNSDVESFEADIVVSTLPPYLLKKTIDFEPALSEDFYQVAEKTHTWMSESIKVALTYDQPFWREEGLSGTIASNVGPIGEMYDHSDKEGERYALKGFLNGVYSQVSREERLALVLKQLTRYYGEAASNNSGYHETVWRDEIFTHAPYASGILPHQNNGHAAFDKVTPDRCLIIAGAETSQAFPGYMEGAILSAETAYDKIQLLLKS